ncbi:hypothetical protein Gotri_006274 [Gossypium trilobum]|uniref:Mitochondrial pyruvate carrier n=1 Tax=Gossypium trilobum TaxID=34281 RepID=A0A7J9EZC1_9ROSI|nr:hypothetical protein [Gossypium trilobum]
MFPISVHFWAPTFKWGISIANVADFAKPPEKLSYPQQIAVTATGIIWSRYSTVITPVKKLESLQCKHCYGWNRHIPTNTKNKVNMITFRRQSQPLHLNDDGIF